MSSAIRVLRRKRRQSNLGTGAAVININATVSFPPTLTINGMEWVITLNSAGGVSSLPLSGPELDRAKCAQFTTADAWFFGPCVGVEDLGPDPDGHAYKLTFDSGLYVAPTDPDTITILMLPPDWGLFTSASGAAARGFINAVPVIDNTNPYICCTHAASM